MISVLLVDDNATFRQIAARFLQAFDDVTVVGTAAGGAEALTQAQALRPQVILLDLLMPDVPGLEAIPRLRAALPDVGIIALTLHDADGYRRAALAAGADDFVTKPFNKVELLVRVKSLLRIKELHDQLERKIRELEEAQTQLREMAITDGLTGLYNYRYFKEQLIHEVDRAARHNESFSLIMLDIDHFKHYNDTHGHLAGDKVLKELARLLRDNVRKIDVAARYGGEEFALILVQTPHQASGVVARKLQTLVQEFPFAYGEQQPEGRLTISMGVSTYPEDGATAEQLIAVADRRLYRAKAEGRNRVVMAD